jgi:hypothetical protein
MFTESTPVRYIMRAMCKPTAKEIDAMRAVLRQATARLEANAAASIAEGRSMEEGFASSYLAEAATLRRIDAWLAGQDDDKPTGPQLIH